MKRIFILLLAGIMAACSTESVDSGSLESLTANPASKNDDPQSEKMPLDIPSLRCGEVTPTSMEIVVVAGESGAPGGFDLHWQVAPEEGTQVVWEEGNFCEKGFASNKNNNYALGVNQEFTVDLADLIADTGCGTNLECGITYVFRVRAKTEGGKDGKKKSSWSEDWTCSSESCSCESGYMIGDKNFPEIGTSNNWGWAHKFQMADGDAETREIHHKNGSLGGEVTIAYENGQVLVTEGEGVTITHLYVSDVEPTETNAPGQFDKTQEFPDHDGSFWVMLKAEVCN